MQRGKTIRGAKTESTSLNLKVVVVENSLVQIELELEKHIKKIKALIHKLRPAERQKYFNGLLSHILDEPVESIDHHTPGKNSEKDYSALSHEELMLIEELSIKMEQLYRTMDHDPS